MALISGWIAVALIFVTASFPLVQWLRFKRRAAPDSRPTRLHASLGMATAAVAFGHTLTAVPVLGSSRALGGGMTALVAGGLAFFVIVAHVGVGLQLRNTKLRGRKDKRRTHQITAVLIAATVGAHVVALVRAAG
jgi:hypothetical protein